MGLNPIRFVRFSKEVKTSPLWRSFMEGEKPDLGFEVTLLNFFVISWDNLEPQWSGDLVEKFSLR